VLVTLQLAESVPHCTEHETVPFGPPETLPAQPLVGGGSETLTQSSRAEKRELHSAVKVATPFASQLTPLVAPHWRADCASMSHPAAIAVVTRS
jgi:hypothetical protein